jgi:hypothetical protein
MLHRLKLKPKLLKELPKSTQKKKNTQNQTARLKAK